MTVRSCARSWPSARTTAVHDAKEGGGCGWHIEGGLRSEVVDGRLGGRSKACLGIPGCEGWRVRYRADHVRRSLPGGLAPPGAGAWAGGNYRSESGTAAVARFIAAQLAPPRPRPAHSKAGFPDALHPALPAARALRGLQRFTLRDFPLGARRALGAGAGSGRGATADRALSRGANRP